MVTKYVHIQQDHMDASMERLEKNRLAAVADRAAEEAAEQREKFQAPPRPHRPQERAVFHRIEGEPKGRVQ
jgi:hypothetical protein